MVWEGTQGQNMRPNVLSHIFRSSMNTVLFVNAAIDFLKTFSSFFSSRLHTRVHTHTHRHTHRRT